MKSSTSIRDCKGRVELTRWQHGPFKGDLCLEVFGADGILETAVAIPRSVQEKLEDLLKKLESFNDGSGPADD